MGGPGKPADRILRRRNGALRVRWEARSHTPSASGTLRVTIHSAVSGRPLAVTVDQQGPGSGTAYANEDPRTFFFVIDSVNLDWSFTVDEQVALTKNY